MSLSDEELIQKAKVNDADAFTALYKRYSGKILGYLYRYIGDYQRAEDLTIQTFMNAYNRIQEYKEMGQFSSWLYRIATNCAKRETQNLSRRKEVSLDTSKFEEDVKMEEIIKDERSRPDYNARETELKEFIDKVISGLDDKYKDVLLLCDVEGLSYEEAGKILNASATTVGTRLMRARDILHDILRRHKYTF
jgi:RNA polymerase sigma-70 factor (ECF subfamily)